MNLLEVIKNRRAVYPDQFNDVPVSSETLELLLEAANWAPSHKKTEPWRFKVLQGEAKERFGKFLTEVYEKYTPKEKFSSFKQKKINEKLHRTSALLVICMQRDPKERVPEWEEIAATAMAVQNLWLAASAHSVVGYWSSPTYIKYVGDFFDLAQGEICLGFFYLGYTDMQLGEGKREAIHNKVKWYGSNN